METKKGKLWEKGIIIALILIVLQLIMYFTGNMNNSGLGWAVNIIFLAGIIYFVYQESKEKNGQLTFGNLFAHGFKISAIVTLIMIVWSILMFKVIFPNLQDQMMQVQRSELLKNGLTDDQIQTSQDIAKKFFMTFVVGGTIIIYALLGVIGALIGAAVSKKKPKNQAPFDQQPEQQPE